MGPDDRAVDVVQIPVQITLLLVFFQEGIKHLLPDALLAPTAQAAVDGLQGSIALRQITWGRTSARQPEEGVNDQTVIQRWTPYTRPLRRQ
jgi:hypothetical protein